MTTTDTMRLFDVVRAIAGRPLTQAEVDSINAVIAPQTDVPSLTASLSSGKASSFKDCLAVILKEEGGSWYDPSRSRNPFREACSTYPRPPP